MTGKFLATNTTLYIHLENTIGGICVTDDSPVMTIRDNDKRYVTDN